MTINPTNLSPTFFRKTPSSAQRINNFAHSIHELFLAWSKTQHTEKQELRERLRTIITIRLSISRPPSQTTPASLLWGTKKYYVYLDEQSPISEERLIQTIRIYELFLNSADVRSLRDDPPEILVMSLKSDQSLYLSIPGRDEEVIIKNQVTSQLIDFYTNIGGNCDRSIYGSNTETPPIPPAQEENQRPPVGINNGLHKDCHCNALLQMIFSDPELEKQVQCLINDHNRPEVQRNLGTFFHTYQTVREGRTAESILDGFVLRSFLFPNARDQQDILESFQRLIQLLGPENPPGPENPLGPQNPFVCWQGPTPQELSSEPSSIQIVAEQDVEFLSSVIQRTTSIKWGCETIFHKAPKILTIQSFGKAEQQQAKTGAKHILLEDTIFLPQALIIEKGESALYQLRSFATHEGIDNNGHYIAYVRVKQTDNRYHYYRMDDGIIQEITFEDFISKSLTFTIAFYKKIDVYRGTT
jgi:hypothetical protein